MSGGELTNKLYGIYMMESQLEFKNALIRMVGGLSINKRHKVHNIVEAQVSNINILFVSLTYTFQPIPVS